MADCRELRRSFFNVTRTRQAGIDKPLKSWMRGPKQRITKNMAEGPFSMPDPQTPPLAKPPAGLIFSLSALMGGTIPPAKIREKGTGSAEWACWCTTFYRWEPGMTSAGIGQTYLLPSVFSCHSLLAFASSSGEVISAKPVDASVLAAWAMAL